MSAAVSGSLPRSWHGPAGAETVVFLNSMGTTQRMWASQLALLGPAHRALTLDLRGHVPGFTGVFGFGDFAADTERVLDEEGVRGATVVGVSLGGAVGVALAAARPDLVGRLVLVNTPLRQPSPEFWTERADAVERDGLAGIAAGMRGRWFPAETAGTPEAGAVIDAFLALPVDGYAAACRALAALDVTAAAAAVTAPTLVVSARDDAAVDPANSDQLAKRIPAATLWPVRHGAHLLPVGRPEALASVLRAFEAAQPATQAK